MLFPTILTGALALCAAAAPIGILIKPFSTRGIH